MTAAQVASVVAPQTSDADPNRHRAKRTSTGLPLLELVMSRRHAQPVVTQVAPSDGIEVIAGGQSRQIVEHIGHLIRNRVVWPDHHPVAAGREPQRTPPACEPTAPSLN